MSEKFKPHAASLVFLVRDNNVLLMKRANTGWLDGYYTLPSGHIDEGESATTAAARETLEEIGLRVSEADLTCVHVDHRKDPGDSLVYIDFFFVTATWQGEPYNAEPEKCSEIAWFDIDNLPENTVEIVKNALTGYKNGTFYSELGW
jgi:ADP-ribose pyrophosphatase YjhB (NUDIX family)